MRKSFPWRYLVYLLLFLIAGSLSFLPLREGLRYFSLTFGLGVAYFAVGLSLILTLFIPALRNYYFVAKSSTAFGFLLCSRFLDVLWPNNGIIDILWLFHAGALLVDFFHGDRNFLNIGFTLVSVVLMVFPTTRFVAYALMALNGLISLFTKETHYEEVLSLSIASFSFILAIAYSPMFEEWRFGAILPMFLFSYSLLYSPVIKLIHITKDNQKASMEELRLAQVEERALKEEIRPHFLLNALNNVMVVYHDSKEEGRVLLKELTSLEQSIQKATRNEYVPIREELSIIKGLIRLFELERKRPIHLQIEIDDDELLIPPMLLEPLVENALQHSGILNQQNGHVCIRQSMEYGMVSIEVEDNGLGRPIVSQSRGIGLSNVVSRVSLLDQGKMDIDSNETGTCIQIRYLILGGVISSAYPPA